MAFSLNPKGMWDLPTDAVSAGTYLNAAGSNLHVDVKHL